MEKAIVDFLIKAKRATYAGKSAKTSPSRTGSHDLVYRNGEMTYYDTYLGGEKFAGEEAIWISDKPYWAMNYIGRVTGENFSGDFLKAALLLVPFEAPYRGPTAYSDGNYAYECSVSGGYDWLSGKETICFKENEIYECVFHGRPVK